MDTVLISTGFVIGTACRFFFRGAGKATFGRIPTPMPAPASAISVCVCATSNLMSMCRSRTVRVRSSMPRKAADLELSNTG